MSEYREIRGSLQGERCKHKSWTDLCERCEIDRLRAENEKLRAVLNERCPVDAMDQEGMTPAQAAIWHVWGERCSDFEPECITCRAWAELSQIERLRAALSTARADALEEAAKVADWAVIPMCETSADRIAAAIRALKEKPHD